MMAQTDAEREMYLRDLLGDWPDRITNGRDIAAVLRQLDKAREAAAATGHDTEDAADMTASLQRAIQRDPNPNGRWKGATLSEDGTSLITDRDGHTYVLTVREV